MNTPNPIAPAPPNAAPQTMGELPIADIHLPDAISAWPPAIGWWLLAFILIASIAALFFFYKKYRKKWGYRKAALNLLTQYREHTIDNSHAVIHVLKRVAISAYPNHDIHSLHGDAWIMFLNRHTKQNLFTPEIAEVFVSLQYQKADRGDEVHIRHHAALHHACKRWISTHNTQYQAEVS